MPILQLAGFDEVDDPFGDAKVRRTFHAFGLGIRKAKHLVLRLKER